MSDNFSKINKTKGRLPSLPFVDIKNSVLGKNYSLSLAFVSEKKSRILNKKYKGKAKPTNVLSFSLSKNEGEIIICPALAKKEAKDFNKTYVQLLGFLFIHGMLHLKGMEHSSRMEKEEKKYEQKYFYRNRCGILDDKSRGRKIFEGRKKS